MRFRLFLFKAAFILSFIIVTISVDNLPGHGSASISKGLGNNTWKRKGESINSGPFFQEREIRFWKEAQAANNLIKEFVQDLQLFFNTTNFNAEKFGVQVEDLRYRLLNISASVENVSLCKELSTELKKTRDLFEVMENVIESLNGFKALGIEVVVMFPRIDSETVV